MQSEATPIPSTPMRVAIDLRWMIPGMAGGLENLARAFVRHLPIEDKFNNYELIMLDRCRYDFRFGQHDNIRIITSDSPASDISKITALFKKSPPRSIADKLNSDILFSFPSYIMPDLFHLRHVLFVADIQHEFHPAFFSPSEVEERRKLYGDGIRRAQLICTISDFSRQTIIKHLGVPPEKITTLWLAPDPIFHPADSSSNDEARLKKYQLTPHNYLFFPAHTWHHKNHKTALNALRILRDRYHCSPTLVCTGGAREAQPVIEELIKSSNLEDHVRFLGYCPRTDIPTLYRGAGCLVFPSIFEGFGIPVAEAMACGCPVVCSNTSSLPEIAGDAALLVDPLDADSLASSIHRVLSEKELREDLIARGLQRAKLFSWRTHTRNAISLFHKVHTQCK